MAPSVARSLDGIQHKPAVAGLRSEANLDRKKLAEDWKLKQARIFMRVLTLGEMTLHEVSQALGYRDQSQVSRWASAADRPQWDRIATIEQLRPLIGVAWTEATGGDLQITVRVQRRA
jgi:hypothetical protein